MEVTVMVTVPIVVDMDHVNETIDGTTDRGRIARVIEEFCNMNMGFFDINDDRMDDREARFECIEGIEITDVR